MGIRNALESWLYGSYLGVDAVTVLPLSRSHINTPLACSSLNLGHLVPLCEVVFFVRLIPPPAEAADLWRDLRDAARYSQ